MLLVNKWIAILAILGTVGCKAQNVENWEDYGMGGSSYFTLPFPSGQYWTLTQSYEQGSHVDYGFEFGDDSYALDFTQNGCEAYGEPVTPMADGFILEVATEGNGDHGYGNTVMVDHGDGYVSRYGHLSAIWVAEGDIVNNTDAIGTVGNTGYAIGSACSEHPGTHLHIALYKDNEAIKPEPLSGNTDLQEYCWYNREGDVGCGGDPGDYTPVESADEDDCEDGHSESEDVEDDTGSISGGSETESEEAEDSEEDYDIDGEGQVGISFIGISPEYGTAQETEFVWVAIVESPDSDPEATLHITNPNDGVTYEFDMDTESRESPYVFTYQKTLNDDDTEYEYWVSAGNGDGNYESSVKSVEVENSEGDVPDLGYFSLSPGGGEADETEFTWSLKVDSNDEPEVMLHIVSAMDAEIYSFEMDMEDEDDDRWEFEYEKTLRDPALYIYWMTAENRDTITSGLIMSVEVE